MNVKKLRCVLGFSSLLLAGLLTGQANAGIVPGDFDNDCDVDSADFQHFRTCALGMGVAQTNPLCADARLDVDADVDLNDFGIFQRCYSGEGVPANPNCNHTCVGANCNCVCGQTNCGGTCTSTASDEANCGACGNTCATGLACVNGACSACPAPGYPPAYNTLCNGVCTNVSEDSGNCGACGNKCDQGMGCITGACFGPE